MRTEHLANLALAQGARTIRRAPARTTIRHRGQATRRAPAFVASKGFLTATVAGLALVNVALYALNVAAGVLS